jgi:hypothetical protein
VSQQRVADDRVQDPDEHRGAASGTAGPHRAWLGGVSPQPTGFQESAVRRPAGVGTGQRERCGDGFQGVCVERGHAEVRVQLLAITPEHLRAVLDRVPIHPFGVGVELIEHRNQLGRRVFDAVDAVTQGPLDICTGTGLPAGRGERCRDVRIAEPVTGVHGPTPCRGQLVGDVEVALGMTLQLPLDGATHGSIRGPEIVEALRD